MGSNGPELNLECRGDLRLVEQAIKGRYNIPQDLRNVMVKEMARILMSSDNDRMKCRAVSILERLDRQDLELFIQVCNKEFPDKLEITTNDDERFREAMQRVYEDEAYVEHLRTVAEQGVGESGVDSESDD